MRTLSVTSRQRLRRIDAGLARAPRRRCRRSVVGELAARRRSTRTIERLRPRPARPATCGRAGTPLEHPGPDRDDQAGLLGQRDEVGPGRQGRARVLPAHQRLDADDAAGLDRHLGLEVDAELLALDRGAQRVLRVQPVERALARDLVEQHQPPAARLLGAVHRGVGVADQVLDVLVRVGGRARCPCWRSTSRRRARGGTASLNDASTRSPTAIASCSSARSSHRIANSSPPKRAIVSWRRSEWRSRSATATISLSPAVWPRLSLMTLKRSRSRKRTAT